MESIPLRCSTLIEEGGVHYVGWWQNTTKIRRLHLTQLYRVWSTVKELTSLDDSNTDNELQSIAIPNIVYITLGPLTQGREIRSAKHGAGIQPVGGVPSAHISR